MTRKNQMAWLAVLTAITLVGQYVMLGNTGIGHMGDDLPPWFWIGEKALWGLRALVEVGVVVYIGMTNAQTPQQEKILWWFKAGLITLIVVTVGPVWGAFTLNETILEILQRGGVIAWGMLLAGISATMLAGVSYAYRVQPFDAGLIVLSPDDHRALLDSQQTADEKLATTVRELNKRLRDTERQRDEAEQRFNAVGDVLVRLFSDSKQERIAAVHERWPQLPVRSKAIIADVSPSYVSEVLNGSEVD